MCPTKHGYFSSQPRLSVFPRNNRNTWLGTRSPLCMLAILSSLLLKRCILQGEGLIKLIIFIVYKGILGKSYFKQKLQMAVKNAVTYCDLSAVVNIL